MRLRLLLALFVGTTFCLQAQDTINTVGLIGSAGPFGWDADTTMTQDTADPNLWHLTIDLIDGEAKFRANGNWDVNWGATDFPTGIGTQGGPNIPVFAGTYDITFNSETGEYNFMVQSVIGLIGDATPNGWDSDINMFEDSNGLFFLTVDLVPGNAKFRQDDDWVINWGADSFPSGIGVQDGPDIPVDKAGEYFVTFDSSTGAYNFEELISIANVGLVGDATEGGWDMVTPLSQDANDASLWVGGVTLIDGGLQFVGNDGELIWGGPDWPSGTAMIGGDTIPAMAGDYQVSLNTETGEYNFLVVRIFETIGIIGDATPGGWDEDTDMERSSTDSSIWSLRVELVDGFAKFRADNLWDVNWGSGDFPSGVGTQDGADIPITAGEYLIDFNSITGEYNFVEIIEYDAVSLVGKSGPFGDWPGDDASRDLFMDKSADDPNAWFVADVTVTAYEGASDEGVKFRADTNWTVNWGAADFPTGIGTQDGDNIQTIAGTYDVSFNSATGEYAFLDPGTVSNREYVDPGSLVAFPNPVSDILNLEISGIDLSGEIQFDIYDTQGKSVLSTVRNTGINTFTISVNHLAEGQYFLRVMDNRNIIGKKLVITR